MNTPNPVIYEFCRSAWETYRKEEDLPVQSLPALVSANDEPGSGVRRFFKVLRQALAPRKSDGRRQLSSTVPGYVAK